MIVFSNVLLLLFLFNIVATNAFLSTISKKHEQYIKQNKFSNHHHRRHSFLSPSSLFLSTTTKHDDDHDNDKELMNRRNYLQTCIAPVLVVSGVMPMTTTTAAAAKGGGGGSSEPTIWKTGKAPIVPGQKPKDKNNVSGTRKDPSFLRSISNCKNQCENSAGPDGYARSKEDCLSDCQDICCSTYEQCTFAIVPR